MIGENLNCWLLVFSSWPGCFTFSPHAECTHPFSTCPEDSCLIDYHMSSKSRLSSFKSGPAMIKAPWLPYLQYNYLKLAPLDLQAVKKKFSTLPSFHPIKLWFVVQPNVGKAIPSFLLNSIDSID